MLKNFYANFISELEMGVRFVKESPTYIKLGSVREIKSTV